jgi:formate hydrogenlyase transcriptional activator
MEQAVERFRTLQEMSNAISSQPSLQAVLQRLHQLLSEIVACDSAAILLLTGKGESLRVGAFESGIDGPSVKLGVEGPLAGTTAGRAIQEQQPIYIADFQQELALLPAAFDAIATLRSGYMFPLSTPRRSLGVLCLASQKEGEFPAEDLALLSSVAALVASALESALATDMAESYQKQLLQQRDRWKLLLEINNFLVSHLNIRDLFRAASASLRRFFANDFAGIWVIDKEQNRLECAEIDFPSSKGIVDLPIPKLTDDDLNRIRTHQADVLTRAELDRFEPTVRAMLYSEEIESLAIAPLSTPNGPLGLIALGSRRPGHFRTDDLDLLCQISTQVSLALDNALAYKKLNATKDKIEEERLYLETEIRTEYDFEDIVGKSAALRQVLKQIEIVAPTDSTVLLHGETGTGKELIARAIHSLSARKTRTFVRLNCAAIPSGLVESELFGHEKGAFTGALMQKKGRFEIADHGTLFLDEIGDIPLELQPKLLRALQEREFERLGSSRTIHVDVRLVSATHRDLPAMIRENSFREDLFYRLNVFPVEIPPLRDRREDIPLLVHYFVSRLARRMQKNIRSIPKASMDALVNAPWPGNIRELENFIERAVILSPGDELKLPASELKSSASRSSRPISSASQPTLEEAERQAIVDALKAASGRVSGRGGAAERLGLKRTTLQNKMRKLGISRAYS